LISNNFFWIFYHLFWQSELVVFGSKRLQERQGIEKNIEGEKDFKNNEFLDCKFEIQDFGFFINFQIPNQTVDSQW